MADQILDGTYVEEESQPKKKTQFAMELQDAVLGYASYKKDKASNVKDMVNQG